MSVSVSSRRPAIPGASGSPPGLVSRGWQVAVLLVVVMLAGLHPAGAAPGDAPAALDLQRPRALVGQPPPPPDVGDVRCTALLLFQVPQPPQTCTLFSVVHQAPPGVSTLTEATIRTGPTTGPMRFVVLRALRSQATDPQGNPAPAACCSQPAQSEVFTPPPNSTFTVPLNLPMVNRVVDVQGEPVEEVDYLGIKLGSLDSSLPLADVGASQPISAAWLPAKEADNNIRPSDVPLQQLVTINGTACPAGGRAVDLATGARAADGVCPGTPGPGDPSDPGDPDPTDPGTPGGDDVRRLSGSDRIDTAVQISLATFAPGVPVAYVATAVGFPDALSAGPLAASQGAPILLTGRDSLPSATRSELERLEPGRIVVLGGEAVVGAAVQRELETLDVPVSRVAGDDRYATGASIAGEFPAGQGVVLVATGQSFPDALAGGAAAALEDAPIVLVARDAVPAASRRSLERLAPERILVLGGEGVVSASVFAELDAIASGGAERLSGPDRYATSAAVAGRFAAPVDTVLVSTGTNFPDALAGTPAAAARDAPILLVTRDDVPSSVVTQIQRLRPREIVVLGGPGAISDAVLTELEGLVRDR